MFAVLDATVPMLPADRPRYLMGVGRPGDIVGAVKRGIDMFDCVLPTRGGRTAQAFTRRGELNLRNARHRDDHRPIDEHCACPACRHHSRAYLHHLIRAEEILGAMLLTWHNLHYYQDIMRGLRGRHRKRHARQLDRRLRGGTGPRQTYRHCRRSVRNAERGPDRGRRAERFLRGRRARPSPGRDAIMPLVNRLIGRHDHVVLTQDWHPRGPCLVRQRLARCRALLHDAASPTASRRCGRTIACRARQVRNSIPSSRSPRRR